MTCHVHFMSLLDHHGRQNNLMIDFSAAQEAFETREIDYIGKIRTSKSFSDSFAKSGRNRG